MLVLKGSYSLILAFLFLFFTFPALAQDKDAPPYPDYISKLEKGGAEVRYLGNDKGLQGWLVITGGQPQYIYNTPNEEAYVAGILLDRKGQVVTESQLQRLVKNIPEELQNLASETASETSEKDQQAPAKDGPAAQLMADMAKAPHLIVGQKEAPVVYAIIDPDCPHCHAFLRDLDTSGAIEAGRIRLQLIPAGILSNESLRRAATLLEKSPEEGGQLLMRHILGEEKDIIPVDANVKLDKVRENIALMQKWKLDVTPLILYQSKEGNIRIIRGKPDNPAVLLGDLPR